ncbi:MAG TPA: hypothetical protein VGI39_27555 [Polyangiaceae bacterium]|jgi:hypothetical protein
MSVPRRPGLAVAIFFTLVGVVFASVFPYIASVNNPNENTRTYTTMALVERHTFQIDEEIQKYGWVNDMARVPQPDGTSHFFQMKGPANAYAGVPVYWAMRRLAPKLHLHMPPDDETASPPQRAAWFEAVTFALRFFTVQIPCFLFLIWFERWLRANVTSDSVLRLSAVLGAGLGTNYLAYSLMFVSHALCAVASFVAFGLTLEQWTTHLDPKRRSAWAAFAVGFGAGWAVLLDYQGLVVSAVVTVFAIGVFWRPTRLLALIAGGAIHVAAMMIFQWRAFGNPLTPGHKFADTPAFAMEHARGIYGIDKPDLGVLGQLCFSKAFGFFGTSPYVWLGLLAIPLVVFAGYGPARARAQRRVATVVWTLAMLALFVSVTGKQNWHGGWSIGPRYYGAAPPFFAFGAVAALEYLARKGAGQRAVARTFAMGLAIASVAQSGLISVIDNTIPENVTRPFAETALPLTLTGFAPHHLFELFGWTGTAPFRLVLACLAGATLLPLALRADERVGAWIGRGAGALAIAAFALFPAFSAPAQEELDKGSQTTAWLTQIWEPQGRDGLAKAREEAERLGRRGPCAWRRLARLEHMVGLTANAMRDEAKAEGPPEQCGGVEAKLQNLLIKRLTTIAGHPL